MKKIILISLLLIVNNAWATLSASVDRTVITLGQSINLTINLTDLNDKPDFSPLSNDFEILGTSSSSQTSIINGKYSSQNTLTVSLIPKKSGNQTIPAIKVNNDMTRPINIQVLSNEVGKNGANDNGQVYLDASVAKQSFYVGSSFTYTLKLYFTVPLANLSLDQLKLSNSQAQLQDKNTQYQTVENGRPYNVIEQKFLITPTKAGTFQIPPAKVKGLMGEPGNNRLSITQGRPFEANSKPITIKIKDIPAIIDATEWLPAQKLKVTDNWSAPTTSIKVGDPLTHTVSLEATGTQATSIPEIQLAKPNNVNVYPDKPQTTTEVNNKGVIGTKTFKVVYIATKAGTITFPATTIKWWDITTDSVKTETIPAKTYIIVPDNNNSSDTAGIVKKESSNTSKVLTAKKNSIINKGWISLAGILAVLILTAIFVGFKLYQRKMKTTEKYSSSKDKSTKGNHEYDRQQKSPLETIHKAVQEQDIHLLNTGLINWAKIMTNKNIYTLYDIKGTLTDEDFSRLLDKLGAAIYHGEEFTEFVQTEKMVNIINSNRKRKGSAKAVLKELYPK